MKKAFTLVELLVAMGVASIIFLLTSSLLLTVITANSKSQRSEAFEQVKNDLGMTLTGVIRWADKVNVVGNTIEADGVQYHLESGRVYKNAEPITPPEVEISEFKVVDYSTQPGFVSLVVTAQLTHRRDILANDVFRVVISQRKLEVSDEK